MSRMKIGTKKPNRKDKARATPKIETVLKKSLRVLNEHLTRHEAKMYELPDDGSVHQFDPRLAKQGEDLVKAANSLGQMYLKIQASQKQMAEMMSIEEKIDAFLEWANNLGRNQWYDLLRGFRRIEYDKDQQYTKGKGSESVPKSGGA